jgi:C4-type Zn-finger protein
MTEHPLTEADQAILPCPFCNREASLETKSERLGYDDFNRFVELLYVECSDCGSRTKDFRVKQLTEMSKYTVQDFRDDPTLRPKVQKDHAIYLEQLVQEVTRAWNRRNN